MPASVPSRLFLSALLRRLDKQVTFLGAAALLVLNAALVPIASAQVATGSTGIDATGDPKSETAACNKGKSPQDRKTCLTEVRNARAAKRAGKLENYGNQFAANALKRCEVFKENDDKVACRARVEQPKIEGSVAEGGILREAETMVTPASP